MIQTHLESPAPGVDARQAAELSRDLFGIDGPPAPLPSERDVNFQIGDAAVLKISNPLVDESVIDLQVAALDCLADGPVPVPRVIRARGGQPWLPLDLHDGRRAWVWMISRLPGIDAEHVRPKTKTLLQGTASSAARLGRQLETFDHPASYRELIWDLNQAHGLRPLLADLADTRAATLVQRVLDQHAARVAPRLAGLRSQVIHADLNPANVLVDPQSHQVSGIIDFGDLVHTALINDLAIALAYPLLESPDSETAACMVRAYHEERPLTPLERELLPILVLTRWATTVTVSLWRAARHPENRVYIMLHAEPALAALARLEKPSAFKELSEACRRG